MAQKFFICNHCQNIVAMVKDAGVPLMCCGDSMQEIVACSTEAATEKHIPVWSVEGNVVNVKVGSVEHPMLPEHYIEWVVVNTKQGSQIKHLQPGDAPAASFALVDGDEVESVLAYCNLHSLWQG